MNKQNKFIREALELAKELTILADEGELNCQDDGCRVLFAVVRDCAYKIRIQVERERREHKLKGLWDDDDNKTVDVGKKIDKLAPYPKQGGNHGFKGK